MNLRCFLDGYSILHKALKLNGILCYSGSLHGILYFKFYVCRCQHVFCYSFNVGCPGEFYYRDGSDFTGWLAGWMVGHDKWIVYEIASNFSSVRPPLLDRNTQCTIPMRRRLCHTEFILWNIKNALDIFTIFDSKLWQVSAFSRHILQWEIIPCRHSLVNVFFQTRDYKIVCQSHGTLKNFVSTSNTHGKHTHTHTM